MSVPALAEAPTQTLQLTVPHVVTPEEQFLFDLQGFLLLKNVLSPEECGRFLAILEKLEAQPHDDRARQESHNKTGRPSQPTLEKAPGQTRLNGLLRLDPAFDALIAHARIAPYLEAFVESPQLANTWSITKSQGHGGGGWHRGVEPTHYHVRNGKLRTSMLNVIWFLTDNGPEDGCVVALPGGHKSNFDLKWSAYRGLAMPGAQAVTGKAGDVFLFSETVLHNGLPKTTPGTRTNLYYNYVGKEINVMTYSPEHNFHFCMPDSIRARFNEKQRAFTEWMGFARGVE